MTETMRQIADAGEALGFLCSSVRCGAEWGPEHDQARGVLLAALRRVAEPVDRVERVARALFAHDEDGNSPVKMRCSYEQLKTHQRLAYEAKARAAIAALEDTRDASN